MFLGGRSFSVGGGGKKTRRNADILRGRQAHILSRKVYGGRKMDILRWEEKWKF